MNGSLTMTDLITLLTVIGGALGLWWRIEAAISKARTEMNVQVAAARKRADDAIAQLAEYKTEVAKNYAPNGYLRDVEERVLKRIDGAIQEIHLMREEFGKAVNTFLQAAATVKPIKGRV